MNFLSRLETRFQELLFLLLIVGVPFLGAGLWMGSSAEPALLEQRMGEWGSLFFLGALRYLGFAAFLLPIFFAHYFVSVIKQFEEPSLLFRNSRFHLEKISSYAFFFLWTASLLGVQQFRHLALVENPATFAYGGVIGQGIGFSLAQYFGIDGSLSFLAVLFVGSAILVGWIDLVAIAMKCVSLVRNLTLGNVERFSKEASKASGNPLAHSKDFAQVEHTGSFVLQGSRVANAENSEVDPGETDSPETQQERKETKKRPKLKAVTKEDAEPGETDDPEAEKLKEIELAAFKGKYSFPASSLVSKQGRMKKPTKKELDSKAKVIEERLEAFGVRGEVTKVHPGTRLTMFEFLPATGVKLSKISALSDDLSLLLGAPSIRILTPIPGKTTVGIEVPNEDTSILNFSSALPELAKAKKDMALPVIVGEDVSGKMHVSDLAAMPHLLVSGTTGSGKSVFVNSLINSLLFTRSPKELRMIMVDPKMIELTPYNRTPHLADKVISDVTEAKDTFVWAEKEMDKRYEIFSAVGARNIESFNEKIKRVSKARVEEKLGRKIDFNWGHMPYIVVVVDELADLMITQGKEVEIPITRIAQKARAAGIHLVLCTQRPSSDIVTGLIKTNFPTRISFKVSSGIDSRTILDQSGAEKLLGNGDMLYLPNGKSVLRLQAPFLSEKDVNSVVASVDKR